MVNRHRQYGIIIAFTVVCYLLLVFAASHTQHFVIFRSENDSYPPPKGFHIQELFIPTPDGQKLYTWWLQDQSAKRTVLFFQGNGRNISRHRERLLTFEALGVNALLIDYRGYGKSTGTIRSEHDIYTDGAAAWRFLVDEKKIPPENIIIWGRSLGGAVAVEIANRTPAGALVLESTFHSLDAMARRRYWYLPTGWFLKFHFLNGDKLKAIRTPVIIIHSVEDRYIPFSQAANLFADANAPKVLIKTKGSHLDLFEQDNRNLARLRKQLDL